MHRYKILKKIGEGAQGIVSKAKVLEPLATNLSNNNNNNNNNNNKNTGADSALSSSSCDEFVAVKKMKIASYSTGVSIETIREILVLRELRHTNVISIIDIFGRGDHIYIILPFMLTDLEILIRNKNILLPFENVKSYMIMLLCGLKYIHSKFILHRDIKPSNCLIGNDNVLVISDFGLAREYGSPHKLLSYQACTIWYRSPELLFGSQFYGPPLDIWSAGCIFAELLLRLPIFPGQNEISQLQKIFCVLGTPTESEWRDMKLLKKYRNFSTQPKYNMNEVFRAVSENGIHLFEQLCKFNPNDRLTAETALQHPYFQEQPLPTSILELTPLATNKQTNKNTTQE